MSAPYSKLYVHLVWATWDRTPWITADVESRLHAALADRCTALRCVAIAVGGVADHVHVLVRMRPAVTVARIVGDLKGASAHLVNHVLSPGQGFRWQQSYGALSLRERDVGRVARYVRGQALHHAEGRVGAIWERTDDDT